MEGRLIVIRTSNGRKLSEFYSLLSLTFEYHKHGSSPSHYAATICGTGLERYPLAKERAVTDKSLRLGFGIDNFDQAINLLRERAVKFLSEPSEAVFGFMAVIEDPEERKIELYKK